MSDRLSQKLRERVEEESLLEICSLSLRFGENREEKKRKSL